MYFGRDILVKAGAYCTCKFSSIFLMTLCRVFWRGSDEVAARKRKAGRQPRALGYTTDAFFWQ